MDASKWELETAIFPDISLTPDLNRIRIKSPQIIGWVSQIVPALPRVAPAQA